VNNELEKIKEIVANNPGYHLDAYLFVLSAINYVYMKLKKKRHISGRELLEGIRTFGSELYGRLAPEVFQHWGVRETIDFGKIVFTLVNHGILSKQDGDSLEEFRDVYKFDDVFVRDYEVVPKKLTKL